MATVAGSGRLAGKSCLLTGSSSGLGRAIAFAYASEGAQIFLVDLYPGQRNAVNPKTGKADSIHNRSAASASSPDTLEALIATFGNSRLDGSPGPRFVFHKADLTVAEEAEGTVAACVSTFGRLDVMLNNAGISVESTHERVLRCHETDEQDYDRTMAINAKGVFLGCKFALRQMLLGQEPLDWEGKGLESKERWDRGWIVNTASIQGLVGYLGTQNSTGTWDSLLRSFNGGWCFLEEVNADFSPIRQPKLIQKNVQLLASYCASKGAVVMLTKQIALDYAKDRIHCNALCPGFLRTAMTQNLQGQPETLREIAAAHPFGGMGDAEDVARAAVFLASRDAAWMTGHPLVVDGGYTAQ